MFQERFWKAFSIFMAIRLPRTTARQAPVKPWHCINFVLYCVILRINRPTGLSYFSTCMLIIQGAPKIGLLSKSCSFVNCCKCKCSTSSKVIHVKSGAKSFIYNTGYTCVIQINLQRVQHHPQYPRMVWVVHATDQSMLQPRVDQCCGKHLAG